MRETEDGLGIHIPPRRNPLAVCFLSLWLVGWAAGEYFAVSEFFGDGISVTDFFLLIWLVPWTIGGIGVLWIVVWQLFGIERLYFTADALVREWRALGIGRRRVVHGDEIVSVVVDRAASGELLGSGVIKVETTGRLMRIGNGLDQYEAELVSTLISNAAAGSKGMRTGVRKSDR